MKTPRNKSFTLLLLAGSAICIALLPWSRWMTDPDARLTARVSDYAKLRKEADWVKLYSMMDARDRKAVALPQFLTLYGSGALKVHDLTENSREIDVPNGTARVNFALDAELQLDRLPANVRRSLPAQDPAQLRKKESFDTFWYWESGEWWLRMDPEAVSRRSSDGKEITPVGDSSSEKRTGN